MSGTVLGHLDWSVKQDKDGHRDYSIIWLVQTSDPDDGPYTVGTTPLLPAIGSAWIFGNDNDPWAFCWPEVTVQPVYTKEPCTLWTVENMFTTRPLRRCQDDAIENPLLEPPRLSGTYGKVSKESHIDKDGKLIKSSSHEIFRGKSVEFDECLPTVSIEMTFSSNQISTFNGLINRVNDATLWGLSTRKIKLSNATWKRHLYGICTFYYTVAYEFEINPETFDRLIPDEGSKILKEGGDEDKPEDFIVYKDRNGENTRVLLDGHGAPLASAAAPHNISFKKLKEGNLLLLGIPASL